MIQFNLYSELKVWFRCVIRTCDEENVLLQLLLMKLLADLV